MIEIIRTHDIVVLSFASSMLEDAGIGSLVLDRHMGLVDGAQGGIVPRLMVMDEDEAQARRILTDAGLAQELKRRGPKV